MGSVKQINLRLVSQRSFIFSAVIFFFLFILLVRLFQLQIIQGANYRKISEENRTQIIFNQAPRGDIFDRNGKPLVSNHPSFTLTFTPDFFPKSKSLSEVASKLAKTLDVDSSIILQKLEKARLYPFESSRIKANIKREVAFYISERNLEFPGFNIHTEPIRNYLYDTLASHIIGYVGEISKEQVLLLQEERYKLGDLIGKAGIERIYDTYIRGKDGGTSIEVSAAGKQVRILKNMESVRGHDIVLTIDSDLQRIAEEAFSGYEGSIVIMEPSSGEILALVSNPGFNPNMFLTSLTRRQLYYLFRSSKKPLFNRSIQAQYAPASVFKIITAIAALEEGVVSPKDKFFCSGEYKVGKQERIFRCWKKEGHGNVDMIEAIAKSCDIYFYQLGLLLGVGNLPRYAREFGLGKITGVDLPGEKAGIVPDRAWKKKVLGEGWWDGDTLNMAIGQGYLWVTPLQIANLLSSVANEGTLFYPSLVKKIISREGEVLKEFSPKLAKKINLKPDTWEIIKKGLRRTITEGTGQTAYISKLSIAGKTGTGQNPHGEDHAWFAGFAPVNKPELAFVVFVEHGGHGGVVAAPIAREILSRYYGLKEERRTVNTRDVKD